MSEDDESSSEKELTFESDGERKRNPPLFRNDDHGLTAWVDKDTNGNYFLRLRLPLGLGTVPLFVNNAAYPDLEKSFNKLVEHHLSDEDE